MATCWLQHYSPHAILDQLAGDEEMEYGHEIYLPDATFSSLESCILGHRRHRPKGWERVEVVRSFLNINLTFPLLFNTFIPLILHLTV